MVVANKCGNCNFWVQADDKSGMCHRYPPTVNAQLVQQVGRIVQGRRPSPPQFIPVMSRARTMVDDFCGEFTAEEDE